MKYHKYIAGKPSSLESSRRTKQYKVQEGDRPLKDFKFYLDIENALTSKKIKQSIIDLGGNIEVNWSNSTLISHYVTDKNIEPNVTNEVSKPTKFNPLSRANRMLSMAIRKPNTNNDTSRKPLFES